LKGQGALQPARNAAVFDAAAFAALPEEIRLRLLMRAINRFGHEGPAELGKLETLLAQLDRNFTEPARKAGSKNGPGPAGGRLKQTLVRQTLVRQTLVRQTLAGALVSLKTGHIRIEPAPARRRPAR